MEKNKKKYVADEEMVIKAKSGDENALDFVLKKYKAVVKVKSSQYYALGTDREDLSQEGMIGLYKAVMSFEPEKNHSFLNFAGLCIERQIMSAIKKANRNKHNPLNTSLSLNSDEKDTVLENIRDGLSPEEILIDKEDRASFKNKMRGRLSAFENKVLFLLLYGYSYSEIAQTLSVKDKAVDNAIQRVRRKLRGNIENHAKL